MSPAVLLFLVCIVFANCQSDVTLNSTLFHATIQAGSSDRFVFAVGLSRNLTQQESIDFVVVTNEHFNISVTSLVVETNGPLQAGPYSFNVYAGLLLSGTALLLSAPAVVDVVPQSGEACLLQPVGVCTQNCVEDNSTTYGYRCACSEGYILQSDGQTCLANDPFPKLLVADESGVYGFSPFTRTLSPPLVINNISAFDYNFQQKALYYADGSRGVIVRASIETSEEVVLHYAGDVHDLAVDWIENFVVFTHNGSEITLLNFNGDTSTLFSSRDSPKNLAIAAQSTFRFLFWSEGAPMSSVILRSTLDASGDPITIASGSTSGSIIGLALEFATETLYWATANGVVYSSTFDGNNQRSLNVVNSFTPAGLDVFAHAIYLTYPSNHSIVKITNFKGGESSKYLSYIYDGFPEFTQLAVYHPLKQPSVPEITNCNMCSDVCVLDTNSIECQCSTGYRLSSDGVSCFPDQVSDLVFSSSVEVLQEIRGMVIRATLDGEQVSRLVDPAFGTLQTPVTGLIYALDYDLLNGFLFYGDRNSNTLWKVSLDRPTASQDDRVLLSSNSTAWDMVFDWIADVLYWTDDIAGTIFTMTSPANSFATTQGLLNGLSEPRGIAVDPFERWLYWVEAGSSQKISRIGLDNSDREVLAFTSIVHPTGVTIDFLRGRLYWGDLGDEGSIESCKLDGSDRQLLPISTLISPFQIDIVGNSLVWTSEGQLQFNYVDIFAPDQALPLTILNGPSTELPLYGVVVVSESKRLSQETHACITRACSHQCVVDADTNPVCTCPSAEGYSLLPDGLTCRYENMCPSCYNGGTCIANGSNLTCSCPVGFTGSGCLTPILPPPECSTHSCQNGGTCSAVNGTGSCQCTPQYSGTDCSVATSSCTPDTCLNGGTCEMAGELASEIVCMCPPGFMGAQCENVCSAGTFGLGCTNECSCMNGATCDSVDGSCICNEGYTGEICDTAICSFPCQNEGVCVAPDVCVCQETFGGADCTTRVCTSDYCQNGGTCFIDFQELSCRCPTITTGDRCQLLDVIPDFLAIQVGVPVGVILPIIFVVLLIGFGVFYYFKCIHKRTKLFHRHVTDDNTESGNNEVVLGHLQNPVYEKPSSNADAAELHPSPYHTYDTVSKDTPSNNFTVHTE